jgi:hypothetical protein
MARKMSITKKAPAKIASKAKAVSSTPVRNSPIPKLAPKSAATSPATMKKTITHEMIACRAYEISYSGTGGSDFDNWLRAERELRGI